MRHVSFNQAHSGGLRLWHWCTFIVILLILFTVFTAKFYVNPFSTAPLVKQALDKEGLHINDEQAFKAVDGLNTSVWQWHQRFGYVLYVLMLFRVVLEFFQPGEQRFFKRIKNTIQLLRARQGTKSSVHYLIVRIIYLLVYGLLITIVTTGLMLSNFPDRFTDEQKHSIKEVHESCFYFLLLYIFIHIAGVLIAERKKYRNIVSGMIHGGKDE